MSSSRLDIRLLGPVDIVVDDSPLRVDTRKAVALLGYLAAGPASVSRDQLCSLLWSDAVPDRARATLRRTLSALRRGLTDRWVSADRTTVRLDRTPEVTTDIDRFLTLVSDAHDHAGTAVCSLCIDSLGAAVELYRGDFMAGFDVAAGADFDHWVLSESERFRRIAGSALERLGRACSAAGRYDEALSAVTRWLDLDPLNENAHRASMLFHAWAGDRAGAATAYRACVATLSRELGVDPLEETTELYEGILEDDLPRRPTLSPTPSVLEAAPSLADFDARPFIGRRVELATLSATVDAGTGVVLVDGEAGIGKTRLIERFIQGLDPTGQHVVVARAHRSETSLAFAPIHTAFSAVLSDRPGRVDALPSAVLDDAAALFPGLASDDTPVPERLEPFARTRFLDAVSAVLSSVAEPLILVVEDIHWADTATVELLGYISNRIDQLGMVMVLSRRPEDMPFRHDGSIAEIEASATVVTLSRFDTDEVGQTIVAMGMDGLDAATVRDKTGGVPLFVVEYVQSARTDEPALPAAIRSLFQNRMAEVTETERQILTAAAVIGRPFDVETMEVVSGRTPEETVAALEALERRSMVRELEGGLIDISSDQLREVCESTCSALRRRLLHRRTAEALTSRAGALEDPVRVGAAATHYLAAGRDTEGARLSVVAGDLAASMMARREAADHYRNALAAGYEDRASVRLKMGDLHLYDGAYGAALTEYETARADAGEHQRMEAAVRTAEVYRRLRRWDLAAAFAHEAWALDGDVSTRARLAADLALIESQRGDGDTAWRMAETSLELAAESGLGDDLARAHHVAGVLADGGKSRMTHLRDALAHADGPASRVTVLNSLALAFAHEGDRQTAIEVARDAIAEAVHVGDRHREAAVRNNLADLLHAVGDDDGSRVELKTAVGLFADVGIDPDSLDPDVWLLREW